MSAKSQIHLHLPPKMLTSFQTKPHLKLYARLYAELGERGASFKIVRRDNQLMKPGNSAVDALDQDHLHIIEGGACQRSGVLNACVAYLQPYWHLDSVGILANSRLGAEPFNPESVDKSLANRMMKRLRRRLVEKRASRYSQHKLPMQTVAKNCLAVFLQAEYPQIQGTANCSTQTMLQTVVTGAGDRPILVKPHPIGDPEPYLEMIGKLHKEGHNIAPTDANVHDVLAACTASISFNSAVAIEGFLHEKPAILFGRSDFHHACTTIFDPRDFPSALKTALATRWPYGEFLHWYFSQCLSSRAPSLIENCLDVFSKQGFPPERLGLTS